MPKGHRESPKREWAQGRPSLVASGGADEARTAVTVIRRMGYVASRVHSTVMSRLLEKGQDETAERFNDCFKPIVDMMVHFSLESDEPCDDDEDTEVD